jgi:hypothetical protein
MPTQREAGPCSCHIRSLYIPRGLKILGQWIKRVRKGWQELLRRCTKKDGGGNDLTLTCGQ